MDEETREALEKSIDRWRTRTRLEGAEDTPTMSKCPLCVLYNPQYPGSRNHEPGRTDFGSCTGCPVHTRTGLDYCYNTPYYRYREVCDSWEDDEETWEQPRQVAALEEVVFLESLL